MTFEVAAMVMPKARNNHRYLVSTSHIGEGTVNAAIEKSCISILLDFGNSLEFRKVSVPSFLPFKGDPTGQTHFTARI